jgi:hypothetical protein
MHLKGAAIIVVQGTTQQIMAEKAVAAIGYFLGLGRNFV